MSQINVYCKPGISCSLCLSSHGALEVLGQSHILHLNSLNLKTGALLINVDSLFFKWSYINSPGISGSVNHTLQILGNSVSIRQQFRQGLSAQNISKIIWIMIRIIKHVVLPERCGRQEAGSLWVIRHIDNCRQGIPELKLLFFLKILIQDSPYVVVDNSIHRDSDTVLGEDLLGRHIKADCPQVHHADLISAGDHKKHSRSNCSSLQN